MNDYSDPGYEYLGRSLASKGYIFVSVDENFLNFSPYEDLFLISPSLSENPARGLSLLEHLQTWKDWNSDPDNPFYQRSIWNESPSSVIPGRRSGRDRGDV